jgi:methyl-accepting chemotaxis protein
MICDQADSALPGKSREDLCSTGNPDMDNQHLRIFQALLRLDESLRGPFPLATLGARLQQLEDHLLEHFRDEEALMEKTHYPLLLPHKAEHELMVERCRQVVGQFASPDSPPLTDLSEAFIALFLRHIREVDMDYANFIEREQGNGLT